MAVDDYSLPPEVAASLRVPLVRYPKNIVPQSVIRASVLNIKMGLTPEEYPALAGDMVLEDLLALIASHRPKPDRRTRY